MRKKGVEEMINQDSINKILLAFSIPKTPREVEKEHGIKKLKLKPFLKKQLLIPLNPEARKGRFYTLTYYARKLLELPVTKKVTYTDWDTMGWVISSPRQRQVVLRTLASDSIKRTSEEIRERASKSNPNLTRISTKGILKELINKGLVETEMVGRNRYYWISEKGKGVVKEMG